MNRSLPASTLLGVIDMQNEIAARRLGLDGVLALACRAALDMTGSAAAAVEMDGRVVCRCGGDGFAGAPLSAPLAHKGVAVGALQVVAPAAGDDTPAVLALLSEVVAAHMTDAVAQVHGPRSDDLTGLGNRRHYDERLAAEVARACASGRDLSLCLFDVSGAHGAPRSDESIRAVARALECVRDSDEAFRIGAEEFAVLLPFAPLDAARSVAGRIAGQIAAAGVGDGLLRACYGVADVRGPDPLALHATAAAELTALKHVRRATVPIAA